MIDGFRFLKNTERSEEPREKSVNRRVPVLKKRREGRKNRGRKALIDGFQFLKNVGKVEITAEEKSRTKGEKWRNK